MIQTYQGYFQEGRFIPLESIKIPNVVEAYVVITGKKIQSIKSKSQRQLEALDRLVKENQAIKDEPLDDEFDFILKNRFNIERELDL